MKPSSKAAAYSMTPALTPDSIIITATNRELMANMVSSMPGTMEPANMNTTVRARHMPPSAMVWVLVFA